MASLLFIKKFLIGFGLVAMAIAVPLTIDNFKNNPYDFNKYRDIYENPNSGIQYDEALKRKCDDKAKITVLSSGGKTITVNSTDEFVNLLKDSEDDKIPLPKDISLPNDC